MAMWFDSRKLKLPTAADALPGRSTAMKVPAAHHVTGAPLEPPFPAGAEIVLFGMGCFWGAERKFWTIAGVLSTAVGYAGGVDAQPDLRGSLLGRHRPHRGRAGRLRPGRGAVRHAAEDVLGEPRSDPGHAPGQRRRHAVPLGDLRDDAGPARRSQGLEGRLPAGAARRRPRRRHHRDRRARRCSTTPRATTSSTCRRTRAATAASAAPASRARWASRPSAEARERRDDHPPRSPVGARRAVRPRQPGSAGRHPHPRHGRSA